MRGKQEKSKEEEKGGGANKQKLPKAFHSTQGCSARDTWVTVHSIPIITCKSLCGNLLPLFYDLQSRHMGCDHVYSYTHWTGVWALPSFSVISQLVIGCKVSVCQHALKEGEVCMCVLPVLPWCCWLLLLFNTLSGGTTTVLTAGFICVSVCVLCRISASCFWLVFRKRLSGNGLLWESEPGEPSTVSQPLSWPSSSDILVKKQ